MDSKEHNPGQFRRISPKNERWGRVWSAQSQSERIGHHLCHDILFSVTADFSDLEASMKLKRRLPRYDDYDMVAFQSFLISLCLQLAQAWYISIMAVCLQHLYLPKLIYLCTPFRFFIYLFLFIYSKQRFAKFWFTLELESLCTTQCEKKMCSRVKKTVVEKQNQETITYLSFSFPMMRSCGLALYQRSLEKLGINKCDYKTTALSSESVYISFSASQIVSRLGRWSRY